MNAIPLSITDSIWVLDGYADKSEPMRHIGINVNPFRIGRSPELALCLQSRSVSKLHAEIVLSDDGLSLRRRHQTREFARSPKEHHSIKSEAAPQILEEIRSQQRQPILNLARGRVVLWRDSDGRRASPLRGH